MDKPNANGIGALNIGINQPPSELNNNYDKRSTNMCPQQTTNVVHSSLSDHPDTSDEPRAMPMKVDYNTTTTTSTALQQFTTDDEITVQSNNQNNTHNTHLLQSQSSDSKKSNSRLRVAPHQFVLSTSSTSTTTSASNKIRSWNVDGSGVVVHPGSGVEPKASLYYKRYKKPIIVPQHHHQRDESGKSETTTPPRSQVYKTESSRAIDSGRKHHQPQLPSVDDFYTLSPPSSSQQTHPRQHSSSSSSLFQIVRTDSTPRQILTGDDNQHGLRRDPITTRGDRQNVMNTNPNNNIINGKNIREIITKESSNNVKPTGFGADERHRQPSGLPPQHSAQSASLVSIVSSDSTQQPAESQSHSSYVDPHPQNVRQHKQQVPSTGLQRPPLPPKRSGSDSKPSPLAGQGQPTTNDPASVLNPHLLHTNPRKGKFVAIAKLFESMLLRGFYFDHSRMDKVVRAARTKDRREAAVALKNRGGYQHLLNPSSYNNNSLSAIDSLIMAIDRLAGIHKPTAEAQSSNAAAKEVLGSVSVLKALKYPQNPEAQTLANDVPFYLMPYLAPPIKSPLDEDADNDAVSSTDGCTNSFSAATPPSGSSNHPAAGTGRVIDLNNLLPQQRHSSSSPTSSKGKTESGSPSPLKDGITDDDSYTPKVLRNIIPEAYLPLYTHDVPTVPLAHYIEQLLTLLHCGIECYLMALCCLSRAAQKVPICRRSVHRMFLCALVVCAKSRVDRYYPMEHYAKGGGVSLNDLLAMEIAFLNVIDWNVGVSTETYVDAIYSLRHHCAIAAHVVKDDWASRAWGELLTILPVPALDLLEAELRADRQEEERSMERYIRSLFYRS